MLESGGPLMSFLLGVSTGWGILQLWLARRYDWTLWDGFGR